MDALLNIFRSNPSPLELELNFRDAAITGNNQELLVCLEKYNLDIDMCLSSGTALMHSAENGCLSAVKLLIEKGANLNLRYSTFGNPLQVAASQGHIEVARLLIESGALIDEGYDDFGCKPASMCAAEAGDMEMLQLLIEHGADIGRKTVMTQTSALTLAILNNHADIAFFLLSKMSPTQIAEYESDTYIDYKTTILAYRSAVMDIYKNSPNMMAELYFNQASIMVQNTCPLPLDMKKEIVHQLFLQRVNLPIWYSLEENFEVFWQKVEVALKNNEEQSKQNNLVPACPVVEPVIFSQIATAVEGECRGKKRKADEQACPQQTKKLKQQEEPNAEILLKEETSASFCRLM